METGDVLGGSAADSSVRPAVPGDAEAIGACQSRAWRLAYADLLPAEAMLAMTGPALAPAWRAAIVSPPSPRHRVLVACAGSAVVGFAAVAPSADEDAEAGHGELTTLVVDPMHQRAGHGSRLLTAATDTLRENTFDAVRVWVPAPDTVLNRFLRSAGLAPDGARRVHESGPIELRLSAGLD